MTQEEKSNTWITIGTFFCTAAIAMSLIIPYQHGFTRDWKMFAINELILIAGFACFYKSVYHIIHRNNKQ